jgi:hypothetical protein
MSLYEEIGWLRQLNNQYSYAIFLVVTLNVVMVMGLYFLFFIQPSTIWVEGPRRAMMVKPTWPEARFSIGTDSRWQMKTKQ